VIVFSMAHGEHEQGWSTPLLRAGYWAFTACVISFMLEQWVYFDPTVALVPTWLPLGRVFWAVATTVAFALAAVALLSQHLALLAARLLTAMLVGFGLLVWIPILFLHPHVAGNWTELAETLSIAGASWVVADYLAARQARLKSGAAPAIV
jgi:hypothetical protein